MLGLPKTTEFNKRIPKLAMPEFKALWSRINAKSVYVVDFDTDELVNKAIAALDAKLHVPKIFFKVESGAMEQIKSKEDLLFGASFVREESAQYGTKVSASSNVKYGDCICLNGSFRPQ